MWLYFAGVTLIILISIRGYFEWSFQYWKRRKVPYIEPSIPFGSSDPLRKRDVEVVQDNYDMAKQRGWKYVGFYIITTPCFVLLDLDVIKNILVKDFKHFTDRWIYHNEKDDPLSAYLINLEGDRWKNLRRKLSPAFSFVKQKTMFGMIVHSGLELENFIKENLRPGQPLEAKSLMVNYGLLVISTFAFGYAVNSFKDPNNTIREAIERMSQKSKWEKFKLLMGHAFPDLSRTFHIRHTSREIEELSLKLTRDVVEDRRRNNVDRNDFLQALMDLGTADDADSSLTIEQISAQSLGMFVAGYGTTASTLTFALFEISRHPDVQEKMRDEIRNVLEKYEGEITYEAFGQLKYVEQVIEETLRLHPAVCGLIRKVTERYRIPDTDVVLEKGLPVLIPIQAIHYDEEYYPNPRSFDPDRFSKENKQNRHPFAYLPFGEGPRTCIGAKLAMLKAKLALTLILRSFKVSLNERTELPLRMTVHSIVTMPAGDVWINFEKIAAE